MDIAKVPDVINMKDEDDDEDKVMELATTAMTTAITNLKSMREIEGSKLKTDLLDKLAAMKNLLERVEKYAPNVVTEYKRKAGKQNSRDIEKY